ncbi:hypothetical protein MJ561_05115 [Klebsiella pneumoniae]|nr:hypothetical protein MJ561_05115 [Klebsiella pneumoniae]
MSLTHAKKTKKPAEAFLAGKHLIFADFMLQTKTVNYFVTAALRWP